MQDGILMKYTTDNKQRIETIVVPEHYTLALMRLAHGELGHNGSSRTLHDVEKTLLLERDETPSV